MAPMRPQALNLLLRPPVGPPPQLLIDSSPELVRSARTWAREFVILEVPHVPEEHVSEVVLIVSELVTNSVRYGTEPGDSLRIVLDARPGRTLIEVHDPCRRTPKRKPGSDVRARGRGLIIVEALAARWGTDERLMGKSVWAELLWQVAE